MKSPTKPVNAPTKAITKKIAAGVRTCLSVEDSALLAGVDRRTVRTWMKRGKQTPGKRTLPADKPFVAFREAVEFAGPKSLYDGLKGIERIKAAADAGDEKAAIWLAEWALGIRGTSRATPGLLGLYEGGIDGFPSE